jgi:hypothetical protein
MEFNDQAATGVDDPTRRRPQMFRRWPTSPVAGDRGGRPRDYGFMRSMFARLRPSLRAPEPGAAGVVGPVGDPAIPTQPQLPNFRNIQPSQGLAEKTPAGPPSDAGVIDRQPVGAMDPAVRAGIDEGSGGGIAGGPNGALAEAIRRMRPPESPMY